MNNPCKIASIVVFGALLSIVPGASNAQDKVEMPTPPYVSDVPDFCQWTITITANKNNTSQSNPSTPIAKQGGKTLPAEVTAEKVVCTRTKEIKRDVIYYSNGNHSEVWYDQSSVIVRYPNGEFQILKVGSPDAAFFVPELSAVGFIGVDWITREAFQGKKKVENGAEVFVYGGVSQLSPPPSPGPIFDENGKPMPPSPPQTVKIPMKAMIAVDSRLPVVIEKDTRILTYSFQAPPTEMLELPADIRKTITRIAERTSYIERMSNLPQR
jgi:hypothetical protein